MKIQNEYRVGNQVTYNKVEYEIWVTFGDGSINVGNWGTVTPKEVRPIPLTEKTLKRISGLRFVKDDLICINMHYMFFKDHKEEHTWQFFVDDFNIGSKMYWLHELQNMWYCLTKNELKIKK